MEILKTRKQGNALTVTIPKSFKIGEGVKLRPQLTDRGIFYEFVTDDDFFDFDEDILKNLVDRGYEGQQLLSEFSKVKEKMPKVMEKLIGQTQQEANQQESMSKEEFKKEIGLSD